MPQRKSLQDLLILIVQRKWIIARGLADAFEAWCATVVMSTKPHPDLSQLPKLSAAVLDSQSLGLRRELQTKGIPFLLYTAHKQTNDVPIIDKPAPAAEVVARVEEWLT